MKAMSKSSTLWVIFWLVMFGIVFFRWYTHSYSLSDPIDPTPIDCSHPEKLTDTAASRCERQAEYEQYKRDNPPSDEFPATNNCTVHCASGQPCGNGCISWNDTCHQPPGSACH